MIVPILAAVVVAALVVAHSADTPTRPTVTAPAAACKFRAGGALPDRRCTPGSVNRAVTQRTIATTICKPGWAASVRPPVSWSEPHKFKAMRAYGIDTSPGHAALDEYDHLLPIELGGALTDERNLWPEPHHVIVAGVEEGSFAKDQVENRLKRDVCAKPPRMKLAAARRIMRTDWRRGQ